MKMAIKRVRLDGHHHQQSTQKKKRLRSRNDDEYTEKPAVASGVRVPGFRVASMTIKKEQESMEDKDSLAYQRLMWDALQKSINDLVNRVNASNIGNIIRDLLSENLIRGCGLFCRAILKSSMVSPDFIPVLAALVAVINTRLPDIGYLLLKRILVQLKFAYKRNDKVQLLSIVKLLAHLVNQSVVHDLLALQLPLVLLQDPSDDNIEVAVSFLLECGYALRDLTPHGLDSVFGCLREILHEGHFQKRSQCLIEGLFAIRRNEFSGYPDVPPELDFFQVEEQVTHEISFDDEIDPELSLDVFKPDPRFQENEERYDDLMGTILGEEAVESMSKYKATDSYDGGDNTTLDEGEGEQGSDIEAERDTNLVKLRRTIYLTLMSSHDFEEAAHKLLSIPLRTGQEMELCTMLVECCSCESKYIKSYAQLAQRLCMLNKIHQDNLECCFALQYSCIHRLEKKRLQNVAKFFAHLLSCEALTWHVLAYIRLTEEDTTSSSWVFVKVLFQELSELLGIESLNKHLNDPTLQGSLESVFPKDNPRNTLFSIKFFASVGLGGLTKDLTKYFRKRMSCQSDETESYSNSGSEVEKLCKSIRVNV